MKLARALATISTASLVASKPCPFQHLQNAAAAGQLNARDAAVVDKMARDPSYIPALTPEVTELLKRTAEPKPIAAAEPKTMAFKLDERQLGELSNLTGNLEELLNNIGGGLVNGVLQPFTGVLSGLDVPTLQEEGLRLIPGDDAFGKAHQFQAPGPTDVRGGCPTLNTLANHGLISRSGITSFAEASNACQIGYGFSYDLSTALSALGVIAGGDLITGKYSIGGADSRVPNTIGPALGLFKHGTFEIDGSITRQDNYDGNEATFILSRWNNLVAMSKEFDNGNFGNALFTKERATTWDAAQKHNPDFNAGVKQFVVSLAERAFVFRGLPNGTTENLANFANIAPFFLNEEFPEQWFRRPTPYSLADLAPDLLNLYLPNPRPIGSNINGEFIPSVNGNIPKTVNGFGCLILEQVFDTIPGQLQPGLLGNANLFTAFANQAITPFFGQFGCPSLLNFTDNDSANATPGDSAGGSPVNGIYPS